MLRPQSLSRCALALIVGISALTASLSHATTPTYATEPPPSAVVVSHTPLTPDGSAAALAAPPTIAVVEYANGAREITGSIAYGPDQPPIVIEYNLDTKTYGIRPQAANEGLPPEPAPTVVVDAESDTSSQAIGSKRVRARVVVRDPVNIVVNETTNTLEWNIINGLQVSTRSYVDNCYGDTTNPAGTKWYTRICDRAAPVISNDRKIVVNYGKGNYENYNWLNPNQGTWSYTSVNVVGSVTGAATHAWNCMVNGESSYLLRCQLYLN